MSTPCGNDSRAPQSLPEAVVRTLRHEVGDLLQTIYAAVAILKERLPEPMQTERRILSDMRTRAESCKELLDTMHDLVSPLHLEPSEVDVGALAAPLVERATARHPQLEIRLEQAPTPTIRADRRRVIQIINLLLGNACAEALHRVVLRIDPGPDSGHVEITVLDDGPGVPPERRDRLFDAQTTVPTGHLGPGLALVRRLVLLHGGSIRASNRIEGGFRVDVVLPPEPAMV
jgi:signal transduction histidine kinase